MSFCIAATGAAPKICSSGDPENSVLLYGTKLSNKTNFPELLLHEAGQYTKDGLKVSRKDSIVRLNLFYALAERMVQYRVRFSPNTSAVFKSSEGDFNAFINVADKKITIATNPAAEKTVPFLKADRDYLIEIYHIYQEAKLRIIDIKTGEEASITAVNDGTGGVGKGMLQTGFAVGMQWDYYCFGITGGGAMLVKQVKVFALKKKVKLLLYGDSITQPEGYFPTRDFPMAWTQQIINKLNGDAMSSGRGGGQISTVLNYIKNELPYIKAKYVMVTIGTNGGNTEQNLSELVRYIQSQGAIPILNNIPANESGSQIANNILIEKARKQFSIKGARLDEATSVSGDGKEVDKSTMYWEDYSGSYGWQIYHHPNEKGGTKIFNRILRDLPEIFE